jgi:hypothetical protein
MNIPNERVSLQPLPLPGRPDPQPLLKRKRNGSNDSTSLAYRFANSALSIR